jgi:hypothetical protein
MDPYTCEGRNGSGKVRKEGRNEGIGKVEDGSGGTEQNGTEVKEGSETVRMCGRKEGRGGK